MHNLDTFLETEGLLFDVRSPSEYAKGHIPEALSFPLFSDSERALVGCCYKSQGQKQAIQLGLSLVGPKLHLFSQKADELLKGQRAKIYCFRGGMRSSSMGWLLRLTGIDLILLQGGYKAYRQESARLEKLFQEKRFTFTVIAGLTGCGKTELLHERQAAGEQILDLEGLANHRGSSFGGIGKRPQPTQEMFENLIYSKLKPIPPHAHLLVEDESRLIGRLVLPNALFEMMRQSPKEWISRPFSDRIERLLCEYGSSPAPALIEAVERLSKRLGSERARKIASDIEAGLKREAIAELLDYYDHCYTKQGS
jgi:tRNA 2-selenouridine synthase